MNKNNDNIVLNNPSNDNKENIGMIHEVGDMGLGFDELSEEDKDKLNNINKEKK